MNERAVSTKAAFLQRFAWDGGHADIWRVFDDGALFTAVIAGIVDPWRSRGVTKVAGVEARGFILGAAAAHALGVGFVAIRKRGGGLVPGPKREVATRPDYRNTRHVLQVQERSLDGRDRVLLVDDWIERGSQASAARELVEACGAVLIGIAAVVDQLDEAVRSQLPPVTSIVTADELPDA